MSLEAEGGGLSPHGRVADVAVIGAGPAGLTAAYLLSKRGLKVIVIEKDSVYVGGISRTVEYKGFRFDIGGHRFFTKSQAVIDLWSELLPEDMIERRRLSRILYDGKFYSYPLRAGEALLNLGLYRSTRCILSFLWAKLFPNRNIRSFQDWTINQFGYQLYSIFFKSYTEKVWGIPCTEISSDWAAQRIRGLNLWKAVADGIMRSTGFSRIGRRSSSPKTLVEAFRYPRLGPGMMWNAARTAIELRGSPVLLGCTLETLVSDTSSGRWKVVARRVDGTKLNVEAAHVISSAPIVDLVEAIEPKFADIQGAHKLKYRDFLTVALIVEGGEIFPDQWIYIHDPKVRVGRIQNYRSWSPEMVPDPSLACLGLEYFCFEGDGLWEMSDGDLIALATRELSLLGLCPARKVVDGTVVRQSKAYPIYDDGYAEHVSRVRQGLESRFETLHLVGRNGMHRYNNQDHSMMTALLTVENIVTDRRRHDVWSVNEDAEYHESFGKRDDEVAWGDRPVPSRLSEYKTGDRNA